MSAPTLPDFDAFLAALRPRLEAGAVTYGNASFTKPLPTGLQEIMDELLDTAGWAWCAWVRLYRIQQALLTVAPTCLVCRSGDTPVCTATCDGWGCTRPADHPGNHIACTLRTHCLAVWPPGASTPTLSIPHPKGD